jgi:hypothetical protein
MGEVRRRMTAWLRDIELFVIHDEILCQSYTLQEAPTVHAETSSSASFLRQALVEE